MLKELIYSGLGAAVIVRQKVEDEIKTLEKKGKIKKSDAKEFLKTLEKKGKIEDKKIKKQIKSLIKEVINELDLATKKDLKKLKEELKNKGSFMPDLTKMRQEYISKGLDREDLEETPFKQFEKWFSQALEAELIEPNAFTLSTVGTDLKPTQRTVLLKMYDDKGFVFFSNYKSKKSQHIDENPNVSAHFAWLGLERQVRIEGRIEKSQSCFYEILFI